MKRAQWITAGVALMSVIALYAATQNKIFGDQPVKSKASASKVEAATTSGISTDSLLFQARQQLTPGQASRIGFLEQSISRGDVPEQQLHIYHQLARFWRDTARVFAPYAWYTAQAARLENSEKSLTFAAHLLLREGIQQEENPAIRQWEAQQAVDLFERSLKLNDKNDSTKVGLAAVRLFGGVGAPMEAIGAIREVVSRDSTNVFAQMTLAQASMMSGQEDKALERLQTVARLQPESADIIFLIADMLERAGKKAETEGNKALAAEKRKEAAGWYRKALPLLNNKPDFKKEVQAHVAQLEK